MKAVKAKSESELLNDVAQQPESASIDVVDTNSLRRFLIAGMRDVMTNRITTWQAKAACNFAQQIYNVSSLEVKMAIAKQRVKADDIKTVPFI